jgi:hypothetical protein
VTRYGSFCVRKAIARLLTCSAGLLVAVSCATASDTGPTASARTATEDPELVELRSFVVPYTTLVEDTARDPAGIRAAEATLEQQLSTADWTLLLDLLLRIDAVLNEDAPPESFTLPPELTALLARHAGVPYLELFTTSEKSALPQPSPARLGTSRASLVELPFTPVCGASCTSQTVFALATTIGYDRLLGEKLEKLKSPALRAVLTLVKACVLEETCTAAAFRRVAVEFALGGAVSVLAPQLTLALSIIEIGKLVLDAVKYHQTNIRACRSYQDGPSCCSAPLTRCGDGCCQGYEACCNGECIDENEECRSQSDACGGCAAGSQCVQLSGGALTCLDTCTSNVDCASGCCTSTASGTLVCAPASRCAEIDSCGTCPAGQRCLSLGGSPTCGISGCTSNGECEGGCCVQTANGGICATRDACFAADTCGTCGAGATCISTSTGPECAGGCASDADCPGGCCAGLASGAGSVCTSDPEVCGQSDCQGCGPGEACVDWNDGNGGQCSAGCQSADECESGCCAQTESGNTFCAPGQGACNPCPAGQAPLVPGGPCSARPGFCESGDVVCSCAETHGIWCHPACQFPEFCSGNPNTDFPCANP